MRRTTLSTSPCWSDVELPRFAKLAEDITVDVVVVGGGVTGITAAYLLKKSGRRVALLEKDRCAGVNTGHTTAHLTHVTDLRLRQLVDAFGPQSARACWHAGQLAIHQIEEIVASESIACELVHIPGYLHASLTSADGDERADLKKEAELAEELGFAATYLESVPLVDRPGVLYANQAKIHPLRYVRGLLQAIPGDGSHIFEKSEVVEFHDKPLRVKANGKVVSCDYIIIATHVPLMGLTNVVSATLLQSKLALYSTYAVGARVSKGAVPEASFWDTSDPYYHLRVDARADHDYVIFGGEDHKTGQVSETSERFQRLETVLAGLLPEAEVDHHWSGQVVETNDGLPFMGETAERQFAITGFTGNGITFGTFGAMLACDAATGRSNPLSSLFDVHRTKIRGGAWDYLKENLDYPYYMLKDWLLPAETGSFESLKPGEGKVVKVQGKRVAAHRRADGKLLMVSPVCTHLGCIVHWNDGEKTWDCPCHGSRFHPTGEVLAGPAETGLEPIKDLPPGAS